MTSALDHDGDLHAQGRFLRSLVRGLVTDEHDREDLVQGALAAAVESPPRASDLPRLRAWLARVVHSRAANLHRERGRRRERERVVARPETVSPEEVELRLELQERVLAAVRALREPYRTAVYLRYLRDLAPAAIAAEEGCPVSTVQTRLARGRELLRAALDRDYGDRRTWTAIAVPLSLWPTSLPPAPVPAGGVGDPGLGVWIMGVKLQLAAVAAAIAGVAAVAVAVVDEGEAAAPAQPRVTVSAPAPPVAMPSEPGTTPAPAGEREVVAPAPREGREPSAPAAAAPPETHLVAGRVLDASAAGVPGVVVCFRTQDGPASELPRVTSRAGGVFELELPAVAGRLTVDDEHLVTVFASAVTGLAPAGDLTVVVAPARALGLLVTDDLGFPVGGAELRFELPLGFVASFRDALESRVERTFEAQSDERGRGLLEAVPAVAGSLLTVTRRGYGEVALALDALDFDLHDEHSRLEVVLLPLGERGAELRGVVLDARGTPVPGARVTTGAASTETDDSGRFVFDLSSGRDPYERWWGDEAERFDVVALVEGHLPARYRPRLHPSSARPLWPALVELAAVESSLSVSGRVVDLDGDPLEGWKVFPLQAGLAPGWRSVEGVLGGGQGFLHAATTDEQGRFELPGLLDHDYALGACDPRSLMRADVLGVPAGARGVEIAVDTGDVWRRVAGRVVGSDGAPIAGALVTPEVVTMRAYGGSGRGLATESGTPIATDADGRFELEGVPRRHVTLCVEHADTMELTTEPIAELARGLDTDGDEVSGLELVATYRLRFQVVLDDPGLADALRVLDADGGRLDLYTQTADSWTVDRENPFFEDGRSQHLFVEDGAATLVLLRAGAEVRRLPLVLEPGVETRIVP